MERKKPIFIKVKNAFTIWYGIMVVVTQIYACVKMYSKKEKEKVCKKKKSVLENVIKNLENGSGPRM